MPAPTSPPGTKAPRPVAALILLCAGLTLVDVSMSSALLFCAHFFNERGVIRAFRVTGFERSKRTSTSHARRAGSSSLGPSTCTYSSKYVEGLFSEVRMQDRA